MNVTTTDIVAVLLMFLFIAVGLILAGYELAHLLIG